VRHYRGKVIEKNGRDVVVSLCTRSCDTCPNQPSCQLLGPWREELLETGDLDVGTELLLWHRPGKQGLYFLFMYGWYLVPFLLLLGLTWFVIPSFLFFAVTLIAAWIGAFRLQSRFFGTRFGRGMLQMRHRVLTPDERAGEEPGTGRV